MSWISNLIGGLVSSPVKAASKIYDKMSTNRNKRAELQADQNSLNNRSKFLSYRAVVGYVCAVSLAFIFIINPIIERVSPGNSLDLPEKEIMRLLTALLGII